MSTFSFESEERSGAFLLDEPKIDLDFHFDVELDVSAPIVTSIDDASIYGRLRHFGSKPIKLQPGVTGAFNLGIKLIRSGENVVIFEERAQCDVAFIEPGVWASIHFEVPRDRIDFVNVFEVTLDMVKEDEYWFASRGQSAKKLEVEFIDGTQNQI
jgi:hypothetical protein